MMLASLIILFSCWCFCTDRCVHVRWWWCIYWSE